MSVPWEINAKNVLVISDVHQNLAWMKTVMEYEKGNFTRLLFNGDIIHHRKSTKMITGTRETARFYKSLIDNYDVNMGNHELPIMESWRQNSMLKNRKFIINHATGYTKSSSLHFNREMTWSDWRKVTMFRVVNGWLVSHAGIGHGEWGYGDVDYNLQRIWDASQDAFEHVDLRPHDLFRVGAARSTDDSALPGGPIWKDWDSEFVGDLPLPQVVGHTTLEYMVRQKGNSYNIDGEQTTYALISENGDIKFKALRNGEIIQVWPITI